MYKKIIEKELVFGKDRYIKATRREIRDFKRKYDRCGSKEASRKKKDEQTREKNTGNTKKKKTKEKRILSNGGI